MSHNDPGTPIGPAMENFRARQHRSRTHSPPKQRRSHDVQDRHYHIDNEQRSSFRHSNERKAPSSEEFEESELFIVDRRGDQKNVDYGSLHLYSIPSYHRSGSGYVVGIHAATRIDQHESTDKAMVLRERHHAQGKGSLKRPLAQKPKQSAHQERMLRVKPHADNEDALEDPNDLDFIAFKSRSSLKRKRGMLSPELAEHSQDYRSIEGQKKPSTDPLDDDLEFASDSDLDTAEENSQREARLRSTELFRKAKEYPNDLQRWQDLIAYQSQLVRPAIDIGLPSPQERQTISDLRISLYERALKHIKPSQAGHDELMVEMFSEGERLWDFVTLSTKWNAALADSPTSSLFWLKYLDFLQTRPTDFSFTKCRDAYVKCLHTLDTSPAQNQTNSSPNKIYVLLRFTFFLRDAGFDELAISLWQVLLETAYFRPPELGRERVAELAALEEFWESDVPRIGEDNAVGWNAVYSVKDASERISHTNRHDPENIDIMARLRLEAHLSNDLNMPAKADANDEDPYRFVIFPDMKEIISPMLEDVPRSLILNAWLSFWTLPSIFFVDTDQNIEWRSDPFLRPSYSYCRTKSTAQDGRLNVSVLQSQIFTSVDLFQSQAFGHFEENTASFIRQSLEMLIQRPDHSDELAEYYLAFVHSRASDTSEVRKLAKRLLKARSNSLRLYNAYALIEANSGNYEKTVVVWKTALTTGRQQRQTVETDDILLWHSWFSTALHTRGEDEALGVLISMSEAPSASMITGGIRPKDLSSSQRLRAARFASEQVDIMLTQQHYTSAVLLMELRAWLTYMLSQCFMDEVSTIFASHISKLTAGSGTPSAALELLLQAKSKIIIWHVEHRRPFKPAVLRSSIASDLRTFPENNILLQAHDLIHGCFSIDDHLEKAVSAAKQSTSHREPGVVSWCATITPAIRRFEQGRGSRHSVRKLFISALLSMESKTKCSAALWTMWLRFELRLLTSAVSMFSDQKQEGKHRTKEVLHNGMRAMPWHKIWAIDTMNEMMACDAINEKEASTALEVLEERELRIRVQSLLS